MGKIMIKTEKVVVRGIAKRKIVDLDALEYNKLPEEYTNGEPRFNFYENSGKKTFGACGCGGDIHGGSIYTEADFQIKLDGIRKAGERLAEINKRVKELKKTWHGEETFII